MRRVLVPLDGTDLAASILLDARRLAGSDGELVLIRAVDHTPNSASSSPGDRQTTMDRSRDYLDSVAETLRSEGVRVRTQPVAAEDPAVAIDSAADRLQVDMIAAATHGRRPQDRLLRGSIAWRALVRSTVPVLLRHTEEAGTARWTDSRERRILVPLDGSPLAEKALPLATALAGEWNAPLHLVRVVPDAPPTEMDRPDGTDDPGIARAYLAGVLERLHGEAHTEVLIGPVVDTLVDAVPARGITDIVMTSHGRTGLTRAIVGSIADAMICALHCPIIVIPPLVTLAEEREAASGRGQPG